jgi:hypothetical protein
MQAANFFQAAEIVGQAPRLPNFETAGRAPALQTPVHFDTQTKGGKQ